MHNGHSDSVPDQGNGDGDGEFDGGSDGGGARHVSDGGSCLWLYSGETSLERAAHALDQQRQLIAPAQTDNARWEVAKTT